MKLKIDNTEYTITPIAPYLSPYSTRISELLSHKPSNLEEAEKTSEEIDKTMEKLLAGTVKPKPPKEHSLQVFNALITLTNEVLRKAGLFRESKGPGVKKSNAASPPDSQAP